jgi:hypothetical protein
VFRCVSSQADVHKPFWDALALECCQAKKRIEAAKAIEENSQMLICEQLAKNEALAALARDNARLKRELTETQSESLCVICRDSKKSEAFVPCGHVCVCKPCYDRLAGRASVICPACRQEVRFTMRVYL